MKRQADGSVVTVSEVEEPETNGNKRIKLLNNEAIQEKSTMNISMGENSHDSNHSDHTQSVTKHNSANDFSMDFIEPPNNENFSSPNISENGCLIHVPNSNCNGAQDEVVKMSSGDSESTELNSQSHENSDAKHVLEEEERMPPVLSCYDSIHNNESTDSFQSEGFEAQNTRSSSTEVSEKQVFENQNEEVKESAVDSDVKKSHVDVDNLMLSHLKITELQGHSDVVHSIAADEDYVLSASSDTTVRVWSSERKTAVSTFSGHSSSILAVLLLTPNQSKHLKKKMSLTKVSRIAITGSLDCNIKLWSVVEGKELSSIYTLNGITCLGYLESECLAVVGTEGGKLELWDIASGTNVVSEKAHEDAVTDIQIKDNDIYSVSLDGSVRVWNYVAEDKDIYPSYARKRKEMSANKSELKPAEWKTIAVSEDILYLGDNTRNLKILDWKAGRLRLFKNQNGDQALCECVTIEKNMLFSSSYDSSSNTGAINVWKLPEMSYVCTIMDADAYIRSLAVLQKENKLQIICGGHKLCIWEFDCSSPPSSETECSVQELENLGCEVDEKPVEMKNPGRENSSSDSDQNNSPKRWCNVM